MHQIFVSLMLSLADDEGAKQQGAGGLQEITFSGFSLTASLAVVFSLSVLVCG